VEVPLGIGQKTQTGLDPITQPAFAAFARAIGAAEYLVAVFHAVPNNFATAMIAFRLHFLNCALETVKDVRFSLERDLKCLVVFVSAMFAFSHNAYQFSYL
jgi:hypothetical protein